MCLSPGLLIAQARPPSLPPDIPFGGGVPAAVVTSETVSLSVANVIKRALDHNLGVLLAEQEKAARRVRGPLR